MKKIKLGQISAERKLDLIGTAAALLGLLTFLGLLSTNRSTVTGIWVGLIRQAFGWGVYIVPAGLLLVGVWLVLRNIERLPQIAFERLLGLLLLFFNILGWFHLIIGSSAALAAAGSGGGSVGAWITGGLVTALGMAGSLVVLGAWLLAGLSLSFDVSLPEIFQWATPLIERLNAAWERLTAALSRPASKAAPAALNLADDGFDPLPLVSDDDETGGEAGSQAAILPVTRRDGDARVWVLPNPARILEASVPSASSGEMEEDRARVIEETLRSFGAPGHVVEIQRGPTITLFGLEPDFVENRAGRMRVRVSKIANLADDLALALAASRIRIQAPVPGRSYVGIEVPNGEVSLVAMRDVLESEAFTRLRSPLRFTLGKDVGGRPVAADLAAMPHLLIAGTTGSGKSVCVNAVLSSLLLNNTPDDLRLILVDPKRVELTGYNGIPHLLAPVVVDAERVVGALQWMMREMDNRYHKFAQVGARNIVDYNSRQQAGSGKKLPYLVVVIDELADLMMLAPDETERTITRLAQLARATGLHLIIATQRPSVDVLTGLIKANFPARIAFAVASGVDSRVILDQPGAERLLGRGDMLFQAPDAPAPVRLQGVYVSDQEIQRLVNYWRGFAGSETGEEHAIEGSPDDLPAGVPLKQIPIWEEMKPETSQDPLYTEAVEMVRREGRASISMLQRKMRIGYTRAARLVDSLEEKGIIGPSQSNTQVRQILDYGPMAPPEET